MSPASCLSLRGLLFNSVFLLCFCLLIRGVASRPKPEPRTGWIKKGAGRKHMADTIKRSIRGDRGQAERRDAPSCAETLATNITAPKINIWQGLSDVEVAGVAQWLFAQEDLNLTVSENATSWDNTVLLIEALLPNKSKALSYIDGCSRPPAKYAHVVLDVRATTEPYYQDITVGPLPVDNTTTTWAPLTYPYTKKNSGKVRNLDADDDILYSDWIYLVSASVADITLDLWNATALGLDNDTIDIWGLDPLWQENDKILRWDTFWNFPTDEFDAETLLPLGLFFMSDVTGRDPSKWKLEGWLYNNIFYNTTEDFRAAYWSPGFEKLGANVEGDWARSDQQGPILPMDTVYPPTQVAPAGSRFSLDAEQKYVEWMGFSFYIRFTRDTGMALYDIRYKGDRILYELGLQEALAHYAGNDPVQSSTSYLDTFYGFGPYAFELVPGYDCPAYATYLNTSFYTEETTHTHVSSICLFEYDADFPIQRHSTSHYVSATKNVYFVIRSASTVGNYDYLFSYTFFMDGSIAVEVRASGYIQSAYYAHNSDYGYQVQDFLSGSMHSHVLNFKADFDILGQSNSVQLMSVVPTTKTYPWSMGKARNTMMLNRSFVETEDDGSINWDPATQVIVVNEDEKNDFGEYRGYRILQYTGTAHLVVEDSSNLVNAAHWAESDIHITRRKDTEPRSAHPYNSQDVQDPPVNFAKFLDGESLRGEDLALWLNLGMHHVPHTGDLPNTVFTTAHSGIQFMPSNYFAIDQSRSTVNMVRIDYNAGVTSTVATFGQNDQSCELDFEPTEPDLYGYTGDVVIRKFPYDPNDPYFETDSIV